MRAYVKIEKGDGRPLACNLDPERTAILGRSLESTIVLHDEHSGLFLARFEPR